MATDVLDRFSREGTLLLGAGCAILLQVANPVVGRAAAEHSDFAHRPMDRLDNTLMFVYGVILGSDAERELVSRATAAAHRRIPEANDPVHQLWVAATLYATAVRVFERVHRPLEPDDAARVLAAYSALGTALEVPAHAWPASPAAFAEYWQRGVEALDVGEAARAVAHDLFHPTLAPLRLRAFLPLANLLTASLLEPQLREAFGMRWSRTRERRATAAWAVVRVIARVLPAYALSAPSRHYLRRVAARTARRVA